MSNTAYGTIEGTRPVGGRRLFSTSDEQRVGLLHGNTKASNATFSTLRSHFTANVSNTWGDIALLLCYIITGLLDSSSVYTWGSFVSMQTGNTIYLGAGLVAPNEDNRWFRALVSIAAFCLGSALFSRFHRYFGAKRRWVIAASYSIQLLFVIAAAVMVTIGPETGPKGPITVWNVVPIGLIAFQSAGQAYMSRVLKYAGLTSVVLTSIYCDLFSDDNFFAAPTTNAERNRRAAAAILLLTGAIFGGLFAHSSIGFMGAIWTAAVLKLGIVLAWCFWAAEHEGGGG
ncbi:hypothetical protein AC579_8862 [Pseudocercospora musae]|uniref:DUF1275 domain protein n=1 Tax=Pseudocercospora musae TaxID=113226 RepID=A0A139IHE4_9PEZI|nr:hypothetical protein AC579_8862 [Pseudocercospora musae]